MAAPKEAADKTERIGQIADLINDRDILTGNPLLTVRDAVRLMTDKRVGAVLVVEDGELVGIFTERDLLVSVVAPGLDPDATPLSEVMTVQPQTVTTEDGIEDVVAWMLSGRYRHLPVVEGGRLLGIVSQGDVMAYLRGRWGWG